MAVEIIEGNLSPAQPSSGNRKYARYKALRFNLAGGNSRSFEKVVAGGAVIEEIARGGEARYFIAKSGGATAVIGVRRADGTAVYAHYMNLEPIVLVVGLLGVICAILRFGAGFEDLPLTPCLMGPLLLGGWYYFRSQRLEQHHAFEADHV